MQSNGAATESTEEVQRVLGLSNGQSSEGSLISTFSLMNMQLQKHNVRWRGCKQVIYTHTHSDFTKLKAIFIS